jgi:hypothetical protein
MPDMYRSPSLEYYGTHIINGDTLNSSKLPVVGTIARGYMPYVYPNTTQGYEAAGLYLKNPIAFLNLLKKRVKYCIVNSVYTATVLQVLAMEKLALNYQVLLLHTIQL